MNTRVVVLVVALLAGGLVALSLWLQPEGDGTPAPGVANVLEEGGGASRDAADLAAPAAIAESGRATETPRAVATREAPNDERPAAASAPAVHRGVTGRVVDAVGNPVRGALVRVSTEHGFGMRVFITEEDRANDRSTVTDEQGRFELTGVESSSLMLAVRASGFAPLDRSGLAVPAKGTRDLGDLALDRGVVLSGRVVDASGRGVEGASLRREERREGGFGFRIDSDELAVTEADGSFTVDHLAVGPWRLRVASDEQPSGVFEGMTERPGETVRDLLFELPAGGVVEGWIRGMPEGTDRDALFVRAMPGSQEGFFATFGPGVREAEVDADGAFRLVGLDASKEYRVQARRRDVSGFGFGASSSVSHSVAARVGERGIELAYQLAATVTARVVDDETGEAIEAFAASVGMRFLQPVRDEEGRILRTHPDGKVTFDEVRARDEDDRLSVQITAVGYEEYTRDGIVVAPGQALDLGEIRLSSVPVVRVTVTDEVTGAPIEGANVTLAVERPEESFGPGGERRVSFDVRVEDDGSGPVVVSGSGDQRRGRTDETGVAALSSFEGETCKLKVEADGYAPFELASLAMPRGQLVDRSVSLGRGSSVVVTVVAPDGVPVADARVDHRAPGEDPFSRFGGGGDSRTDQEGRVRFDHLAAGEHAFQLAESEGGAWFGNDRIVIAGHDGGADDDWSWITVDGRGAFELTITTASVGTLEGRVTEAGKPLAGAQLSLRERNDDEDPRAAAMRMFGSSGPTARTDGEGRYSFEDVEEGEYVLEVTHASRCMANEFDVRVRPGTRSEDFDLPISILEGRITDPDGEPLPGVKVTAERAPEEGAPRVQAFRMMMVADNGDEAVSISDGSMGDYAVTDGDGRYVLRGVAPDVDLLVNGEHESAQPGTSERVRVGADEAKRGVDLVLEPAGTLKVSAVNADGSPARFLLVTAQFSADASVSERGFIGTDGSTTLTGLRPGVWVVSVSQAGPMGGSDVEPPPADEVEVIVGEEATVEFTM